MDHSPAFPNLIRIDTRDGPQVLAGSHGLTKTELACIELRIPKTGDESLDALIREAQRRDLAGQAMPALIPRWDEGGRLNADIVARRSVEYADVLIAELSKETP